MNTFPARFLTSRFAPVFLAIFLAISGSLPAAEKSGNPLPAGYPRSAPAATLPDPRGKSYNIGGKLTRPLVLLISVPSFSQGSTQEKWAKRLALDTKTKLPNGVDFYLVQDMKQTGFAGEARKEMKEKYQAGDRPIPLLDETGAIGKKYGLPRDKTVVLVYSKSNKLKCVEIGAASDQAVARVRDTVAKLVTE